jgi:hypothetical protein
MVRRLTTPVAEAVTVVVAVTAATVVAAEAAVDNEDGVRWRRWEGRSMAAAVFGGIGDGLRIGNGKGKIAIDTSGGGWQWRASAFDGGDGQRWVLAFDGGNGQQLWQRWTIETAFNGSGGGGIQWGQAFDGI